MLSARRGYWGARSTIIICNTFITHMVSCKPWISRYHSWLPQANNLAIELTALLDDVPNVRDAYVQFIVV